jgi:hypothetical protein
MVEGEEGLVRREELVVVAGLEMAGDRERLEGCGRGGTGIGWEGED